MTKVTFPYPYPLRSPRSSPSRSTTTIRLRWRQRILRPLSESCFAHSLLSMVNPAVAKGSLRLQYSLPKSVRTQLQGLDQPTFDIDRALGDERRCHAVAVATNEKHVTSVLVTRFYNDAICFLSRGYSSGV